MKRLEEQEMLNMLLWKKGMLKAMEILFGKCKMNKGKHYLNSSFKSFLSYGEGYSEEKAVVEQDGLEKPKFWNVTL